MGPFGKLTSKLKGQQKEVTKNDKHGMECKSEMEAQSLQPSSFTHARAGSMAENNSIRPAPRAVGDGNDKGKHGETWPTMEAGARNQQAANIDTPPIGSVLGGAGDAKMQKSCTDEKHTLSFPRPLYRTASVPTTTARGEGKFKGESDSTAPIIMRKIEPVCESADLDSSSLSLSLGLNRIKTRSGPLNNEAMDGEIETAGLGSNPVKGAKAAASGEKTDSAISEGCARQGLVSVEMDRSKVEAMGTGGRCEGSHGKKSLATTHFDADMATESSHQGKTRRKSKTESSSQRLQRDQSGRRPTNSPVIPMIGKAFTTFGTPPPIEKLEVRPVSAEELPKASMKSVDNLDKKVPSSLLSYLNNEFNESFDMEASMKQLDVIKEGESPTFVQVVPPITQLRTFKKWPKDIKSFSHELGHRGGRTHDVHRPHSDNDLEELLAALRARFNTAKEAVDAELKFFAADLVEILDRNTDSFPGWKENVEDLLVLAQRCTEFSPVDFRRECENIVHVLDERRQELPVGLLKRLHTRMLFILTRCTRLLQFQKETIPEEEGLHKVQQCLKGVPSVEQAMSSGPNKRCKGRATSKKLLPEVLEQSARSDAGLSKLKPKHLKKHKLSLERAKLKNQRSDSAKSGRNEFNRLLSLKKLPAARCENFEVNDLNVPAKGFQKENVVSPVQGASDQAEIKLLDADRHTPSLSSPTKHGDSNWVNWPDYEKEELEYVICRICEEEVLTSHLEPHSLRCTLAEACDNQGVNVDERLRMLADNLERIAELSTPKSNQTVTAEESLDGFRLSKLASIDGSDNASPQSNDYQGKVLDVRLDDVSASEAVGGEDTRGLSLINFKRLLGIKADQGVTSSSAGSGTPRSALTTPRTSQLDLLWAERNSFVELEDTSQIHELAAMARDIASRNLMDEGILDLLGSSLEELHELLGRNKIADLTVDTFGKRIEKLLREKVYIYSGAGDMRKFDSLSGSFEDDGMSTDEGVPSFRSTPTHPLHSDRIRIEDFDMLKLISRGAFGRVFLAKKQTTGDLFAIKVLRKTDMIRKNAVENILAERDILITVCNPFVVRFFYSFTCRDNLYLVMEYLNGGDLYSLLRHMGCLDEDVARVYIAELVLALEYLHSLGVVHRDLKPDNILIAHDGHIKLTDFGLSKVGLINSTDDLSGPTNGDVLMEESMFEMSGEHETQRECRKERSAVGTPDYLAPEILLGTEHGYTADWWSVGVILFECIMGLPPFNAEHPQIIFDNILNRKIPWPRVPEEMSEEAKDLIDKLLTEDPNQRLGAKGAPEVKSHHFFKDISWDNLARQKAAFVPSPESVDDTSYFTSRHTESYGNSSPRFLESSDCSTRSSSSNSVRAMLHEGEDECGDLAEFQSSPSVERTFNNFSFKNASQLAFMNYDILSQSGRDGGKGHSRHQSAS